MRLALAAWEIGRRSSGFGAQVGGLGLVLEELPPALHRVAAEFDIALTVDTLSPCFAHYDREQLTRLDLEIPARIEGRQIEFEVYQKTFSEPVTLIDGRGGEHTKPVTLRNLYFWNAAELHWTDADTLYAVDPWQGLKAYSAVSQAIAGYLGATDTRRRPGRYHTVHLHDYHVGLTPFFLDASALERIAFHFTVHNATYQGLAPVEMDRGEEALARIGLSGRSLFQDYFDFFGHLNPMRACLRRVHELGGRIATVSGDLDGRSGYAYELSQSHSEILAAATRQKGAPPVAVFVPNRHLDLFEKLPIAGITNGLSANNRPENLPALRAAAVRKAYEEARARDGAGARVFRDDEVQVARLTDDFDFDAARLEKRARLKRLLHRECFGWDGEQEGEPAPILFAMMGRLVEQKNFEVVLRCLPELFELAPEARLVVQAGAPEGPERRRREAHFTSAAETWPQRVFFSNTWDPLLAKMILAGSDFTLVPSQFEPCGLVDYEASLLGSVVIARRTGGLSKMDGIGYLYDWLDVGDPAGEARALFEVIERAVRVLRDSPDEHATLIRRAMAVDTSWDRAARQYMTLYRYGHLAKKWRLERRRTVARFATKHGRDPALRDFFRPAGGEFADPLDQALLATLKGD